MNSHEQAGGRTADTARERAEKVRTLAIIGDEAEPAALRRAGMRRALGYGGAVALCAASLYFMLAGNHVAPARRAAESAPPALAAAAPAPAANAKFEAQGFVTATRRATVSTLVSGIVTAVPVAVGERVEKGQVIGVLDAENARRSLQLAERQYEATVAGIASAQAQLKLAEGEFQQENTLQNKQFSSVAKLAQKKTALDVAAAALVHARAEAAVDQVRVEQQRIQLSYHTIRAPFGGIVIEQNAQPGELIAPSSAGGGFTRSGICTIVDTDSLEVVVDVSEQLIRQVRIGGDVEMSLYAYDGAGMRGKVSRIMPSADRAKGTLQVRVTMSGKDHRVLPEMRVRVQFL